MFDKMGEYIEAIKEFNANVGSVLKIIKRTWEILTRPSLLFGFIESGAFVICLVIICAAVIAYAVGYQKASKFITGSMAVYVIIKMIGTVI